MRKLLVTAVLAATLAAPTSLKTIAGNGTPGFSAAQLHDPLSLVAGPDGALYFSEYGNHMIRRLDLKTRALTTIAGNGKQGYDGEGGPAINAMLNQPLEIQFDTAGNLYIADTSNNVVQKVDAKTKTITTIAGTGKPGFAGDGGPAVKAQLRGPGGLAFLKDGSLLICDVGNNRIRRIDFKTGMIDTFAGTGERKPTPDGAPLQGTPLRGPRALAVRSNGDLYLALNTAIYKIDTQANRITHVAGAGGEPGPPGDGPGAVLPHLKGDAKQATLSSPKGITLSPDGSLLYVADTESHRILRIDMKTGVIETIAGTGERGDDGVGHNAGVATSPDGDPLKCKLSRPHAIVVDSKGAVYFTDSFSNRIRVLR